MIYEDRKLTLFEKKAKKTAGRVNTEKDIDATIMEVIQY